MSSAKDNKTIADIILSFKTYGIGDIKHNRRRTISAFILTISFIDQLASFRYPTTFTDNTERTEKFIADYLPTFSKLGLYAIFRQAILHHYSSKRKYGLTNNTKEFPKAHATINGRVVINTSILMRDTIKAFKIFEQELLTNSSDARKNAIKRARKHPPLIEKPI